MNQRLRKTERLTNKKVVDSLFSRHNTELISVFSYPLKVSALPRKEPAPTKILITVPKRNFKKAVDRNLIRRRTREAYRLHKSLLSENAPGSIAFVYIAKEILSYQDIEKKMKIVLKQLQIPKTTEE